MTHYDTSKPRPPPSFNQNIHYYSKNTQKSRLCYLVCCRLVPSNGADQSVFQYAVTWSCKSTQEDGLEKPGRTFEKEGKESNKNAQESWV